MRWVHNISLRTGALAALTCMAVSACTTASLHELRQVEPSGDPFLRSMAAHYLQFAEQEAQNYDWADSQHFARKGLQFAYGNVMPPENPAEWDIPEAHRQELADAYMRLTQTMTEMKQKNLPEYAADAQYYFDCWVEEAEEDGDVARCHEGFETTLKLLETGPERVVEKHAETPLGSSDDGPVSFRTATYILLFANNAAELSDDDTLVLDNVFKYLSDLPRYDIIVNGHTDRSGDAEFNLELALDRAEKVKAAMVAKGIDRHKISIFSFGESDPRVPTADGVKEPANRRVEIYVSG